GQFHRNVRLFLLAESLPFYSVKKRTSPRWTSVAEKQCSSHFQDPHHLQVSHRRKKGGMRLVFLGHPMVLPEKNSWFWKMTARVNSAIRPQAGDRMKGSTPVTPITESRSNTTNLKSNFLTNINL